MSRAVASRLSVAATFAAALVLAGAAPGWATGTVKADRLAGADRYGTARAVTAEPAFSGTTVVVTSGESYPDALSAATYGAPVVLTTPASLPDQSRQALADLRATRSAAIVVGGTAAVSDAVLEAVRALGYQVRRVAGADRFATAAQVAIEHAPVVVGGSSTAIVVSGRSFPDALAAAPTGLPLLLVEPDGVPDATEEAIARQGIHHLVVVGGTAAVSDAVVGHLASQGRTATRVAATTAAGTAAAVGNFEITSLGFSPTTAILASSTSFPDGLTGGALGVAAKAPVVLVDTDLPAPSQEFLDRHAATFNRVVAVGGTATISAATLEKARQAAQSVTNDAAPQGRT